MQRTFNTALTTHLAMLSPQQLWENAMKVLTQDTFAMDDTGGCLYRSPDGNKCGIGHSIPEHLYDPQLDDDGESVSSLIWQGQSPSTAYVRFATSIQDGHDSVAGELDSHRQFSGDYDHIEEPIERVPVAMADMYYTLIDLAGTRPDVDASSYQ